MPTHKYFSQCPPFPSDVPVVDIPKVSFADLQNGNAKASTKMFDSCRDWGFFLLDLTGSEYGEKVLLNAEKMLDITSATFGLDQDTLDKYAFKPPHDVQGYKATNVVPKGMELYAMTQDDILGNSPTRGHPPTITDNLNTCQEFMRESHGALEVVLSQLDKKLGVAPGTLEALNPLDQASETIVRMLLSRPHSDAAAPNVKLLGHTDLGSITLLFNVAGGLQILPSCSENIEANWRYIRPEPGCAVVNIGDIMVEWTGGVLKSALHRVVTPPGEQASVTRRSVAYLVRPALNAPMSRLQGSIVIPPSKEGEEETRSVAEWVAWRNQHILTGVLKPETKGGRTVR